MKPAKRTFWGPNSNPLCRLAALGLIAGVGIGPTALRADEASRSIWDGVYTAAQAQRGAAEYTSHCVVCHMDNFAGDGADIPALSGKTFLSNWDGLALAELFDRIHTTMPQNNAGSLSARQVADLMAFLLSVNKIPAGATELPADVPSLQSIQFNANRQGAPTPAAAGAASTPPASTPPANEWPTYGYDQERTGWNRAETTLNKNNVSKLKVQWSTKLSTPPTAVVLSTLSPPVVAAGVSTAQGVKNLLFLLGADDTLFALDTDSGKVLWQKTYPNPIQPGRPATWLCANTTNGAPAIDKANGVIYFLTSDGKLRGASLSDGAERLTPTYMVAPFARAWGLNIIDDVVYTTSGRGCGQLFDANSPLRAAETPNPGAKPPATSAAMRRFIGGPPIDPGMVAAVDLHDPAHPQVTRFYTSNGRPAGSWGRGGVTRGPNNTLLMETADGFADPASGQYGISVLMLAPKAARLMDLFTPKNWRYLNAKDLDWSASPLVFPFGGKTLVAVAGKEAVIDLLDTTDLGGGPSENHSTPFYQGPQLGNDAALGTQPSQGIWGGIATYETSDGKRFIYTPMWGPQSAKVAPFKFTSGPVPNGSIMAVQVVADGDGVAEIPTWTSPDMIMPDPPVVANGVVYATQTGGQARQNTPMLDGSPRDDPTTTGAVYRATPVSNLVLYAFDAQTGKVLYSSGKTITDWVHFGEPVVALGKVFVVTHDAHVYAFGVK